MPLNSSQTLCGKCLKKKPSFKKTIAILHYDFPVSKIITDLKFNGKLLNADILAHLLLKKIDVNNFPDYIIPVPLHKNRLKERGFNQALEIAKPISKTLNIPILKHACQRTRHTEAQSSLPAKKRHKNIKNAFTVQYDLRDKKIAIIDDVMTTGHTVSELSRSLLRAGAKHVAVWCCTRA